MKMPRAYRFDYLCLYIGRILSGLDIPAGDATEYKRLLKTIDDWKNESLPTSGEPPPSSNVPRAPTPWQPHAQTAQKD